MAKSGSHRVRDYRIGKAHITFYMPLETKIRFDSLSNHYQLSQSELLERLVAIGETTPIHAVKKRLNFVPDLEG
jgi:hypothetical protein